MGEVWLVEEEAAGKQMVLKLMLPKAAMNCQQIINYRYAKPDADVWAAAASYYFMLTDAFPKNLSGKDMFAAALGESAIPIRKKNANIPRRLAAVINEALVDKPSIQIKSASEYKKMIEGAL